MMTIKSFNSDVMYKVVVGHELGHEMGVGHDDSMNNIMNSSANGNTSPLFTEEHKQNINEKYAEHLIETNSDRNCTTTSVDDLTGYEPTIRVYPNPVTNSSKIMLKNIDPASISSLYLASVNGTMYPCDTKDLPEIDLSKYHLPGGVYAVLGYDADRQQVVNEKLLIINKAQ